MSDPPHGRHGTLEQLCAALARLAAGEYDISLPPADDPALEPLRASVSALAAALAARERENRKLDGIVAQINAGLTLGDVLDSVYEEFRSIIPYNRIGLSLIEADDEQVRAVWARTDRGDLVLGEDYRAPLAGSSLQQIIQTGEPRILNDLVEYARAHPQSESTRLILEEGIRASLTCPLIVDGAPVGFMFFSSTEPGVYSADHVRVFKQIAAHLAVAVEKAQLTTELAARKTAVERHNQALQQLNAELARLNELKNTFVGVAAHDLRSPIAYLQVVAQTVADPQFAVPPQQMREFFHEAQRQTTYMLKLLDSLLDVSQIEAGQLTLNLQRVDLAPFLQQAAERHTLLALNKRLNIVVEETPAEPLYADAVRLRQVIDNLLSNAVKFSPEGGTVHMRARQRGDRCEIEVQDAGPGIDPAEQHQLFEYFARLSVRPSGGEKSTGLGLAISRRIVEAHGGTIEVDSVPGQGATFRLILPA